MMVSATSIQLYSGDSGYRPGVRPVHESFRADDAKQHTPSASPRRTSPDLTVIERVRREADLLRLAFQCQPGARVRHAMQAYSAIKDLEKKAYVSAVMGVDEFA